MGIKVRGGQPPLYMGQRLDILISLLSQFAYQPPPPASGNATLFVNQNTGNDNYTYDQIRNGAGALQWRTLTRAVRGSANITQEVQAQAARAGDVVRVDAGTYTSSQAAMTDRPYLVYQPANSGTIAQPIEFRANGVVRLEHTVSTGAAVIGASSRNYIRWRGFTIDEATARPRSDRGPVVLWHVRGCEIHDCDLRGIDAYPVYGFVDNHNGVRVEDSFDCIIRNNRIDGFTVAGSHNGAGIMSYDSQGITVENNEILNCHAGMFIKGQVDRPQTGWIIRNNYIHNNIGMCILLHAFAGGNVYRNILTNSTGGVQFLSSNDPGVLNANVINNVIHNIHRGDGFGSAFFLGANGLDVTPCDNNIIANNIISDVDYMINAEYGTPAALSDLTNLLFKHNLYHQYANAAFVRTGASPTTVNLATWQGYGQDADAVPTIFDNPDFISPGTNFRLGVGSPALNSGRDILNLLGGGTSAPCNMGAYLTGSEVIGLLPTV